MKKGISPLIKEVIGYLHRIHGISQSKSLQYLLEKGLVIDNKLTEQGLLLVQASREYKL